jgi:hypothetical protein
MALLISVRDDHDAGSAVPDGGPSALLQASGLRPERVRRLVRDEIRPSVRRRDRPMPLIERPRAVLAPGPDPCPTGQAASPNFGGPPPLASRPGRGRAVRRIHVPLYRSVKPPYHTTVV